MDLFKQCLEKDKLVAHLYLNGGIMCPLHVACESGRLDMVKHLIAVSEVNINTLCRLTGYSPLMYAS